MPEENFRHLDSRPSPKDGDPAYTDYQVDLNDPEVVQTWPFSSALRALGELGMSEVVMIPNPEDAQETTARWWVLSRRHIQGTQPPAVDEFEDSVTVSAAITYSSRRVLEVVLGTGTPQLFQPEDYPEAVWDKLTKIHNTLMSDGATIPRPGPQKMR